MSDSELLRCLDAHDAHDRRRHSLSPEGPGAQVQQAVQAGRDETLRAGLSAPAVRQGKRYKVKPAARGGVLPGVNLDKALALADAIETRSSPI